MALSFFWWKLRLTLPTWLHDEDRLCQLGYVWTLSMNCTRKGFKVLTKICNNKIHVRKARNEILCNCLNLLWNISDVNLNEQDDSQPAQHALWPSRGYTSKKSEYLCGRDLQVLIYQLQLFLPLLPPPQPFLVTETAFISTKGSSKGNGMKYKRLKIIEKKFIFFLKFEGNVRVISTLFWNHILFESTLINLSRRH